MWGSRRRTRRSGSSVRSSRRAEIEVHRHSRCEDSPRRDRGVAGAGDCAGVAAQSPAPATPRSRLGLTSQREWRWTSISALRDDLTEDPERLVRRREPHIAAYLEQRLTQLLRGPPQVQRAAQVRLELLMVPRGGEYRHHHQAAILQVQTGPIPQSAPNMLDGGLEEWRQKRIALCRRFTNDAAANRCAARPCFLCQQLLSVVHNGSSLRVVDYLAPSDCCAAAV